MRNLFLVHTPFQLMNSLNIIESYFKSDTNEIVFLHKNLEVFEEMVHKYSDKLKIYEYDFLYDDYSRRNKLLIRFSLIFDLIKGKYKMKKDFKHNVGYDKIFIPSENIACNIVYNHFLVLNKSLQLYVYDDGVGTYAEGYLRGGNHKIYRLVSLIIFRRFFWKDICGIYCYQPELINDPYQKVVKSKIVSNRVVENLFSNNLSNEIVENYEESKVIFLDQGNLSMSRENTQLFLDACKKFYKHDEVIFKNHPRIKSGFRSSFFSVDDSGNSLESIFFNVNIENKVLVSMCSTSCLTPFILKGIFPYVIFLGMLDTDDFNQIFSTPYFKNVIDNYEAGKIFMPKNKGELYKTIEMLALK